MELPAELIVGILVRLPVKDVFISKSVCKSWYALISNPNFTRIYAENTPFSTVFISKDFRDGIESLSLFEFSADGEFTEMPFDPQLPQVADANAISNVSAIGLCNDSTFLIHRICFGDYEIHKVYQWNPFWGSCVKALECRYAESYKCAWVYKVGCIPFTDTYKLVRIRLQLNNVAGAEPAKIFTVGVDTNWRVLDDPLNFYALSSPDLCCFNGAYHWTPRESKETICTFDILEEKSGPVISKPPASSRCSHRKTSIGVYKGRLLLIDHTSYSEMVIWTMKEYGVTESWSIDVVLRVDTPGPMGFSLKGLFPIAVLPNGHVLCRENYNYGYVIVYSFGNLTSRSVKVLEHPYLSLLDLSPNTFFPRFHPIEGY